MIFNLIRDLVISMKFRKIKFSKIGKNCQYKFLTSKFLKPDCIELGDNVYLGEGTEIHGEGGVIIGNGVIFGPEVCIYSRTHCFNAKDLSALPFDNRIHLRRVLIKDYVWIGRRVIILPGVTIGKASVIGSGAVVSKDVPDYAIVVGNPAKVVKFRDKEIVDILLNSEKPFVYEKYGHYKSFVFG